LAGKKILAFTNLLNGPNEVSVSSVGAISLALLHKYLKLLRGKDRQLNTLIYQTLYNEAFRRKAESLCNNAHLFYKFKQNGQYYIPVGLFAPVDGLVFDHQVFIDEKPEYYSFANETRNLTGAELFAQFAPQSEQ
jgi:hypothetical protein